MSDQIKSIRTNLEQALALLNSEIQIYSPSNDRYDYVVDTRRIVIEAIGRLESYRASGLQAPPTDYGADDGDPFSKLGGHE